MKFFGQRRGRHFGLDFADNLFVKKVNYGKKLFTGPQLTPICEKT